MHGPPTKYNNFENYVPLSNKLIPAFKAEPLQRYARSPALLGHGSTYKSSNIELNENSHSLIGTKNLRITSGFVVTYSISIIFSNEYSLFPLNE